MAAPTALPSRQRRRLPSPPPLICSPFFSSIRLNTWPWPVGISAPNGLPSRQRRRLPSIPPLISSPFFRSIRLNTRPWPVGIESNWLLRSVAAVSVWLVEKASSSDCLPKAARAFTMLPSGSVVSSTSALVAYSAARASPSRHQAMPPPATATAVSPLSPPITRRRFRRSLRTCASV